MIKTQEIPTELRSWFKEAEPLLRHHNYDQVWDDFLTLTTCYFAFGERQEEYQKVASRYQSEEVACFARMMSEMVLINQRQLDPARGGTWYDFFGKVYETLGAYSKRMGQFFTPEPLCENIAMLTAGGVSPAPPQDRVTTVLDPASGSGRLLLAFHHLNYKNKGYEGYYCAQDLDMTCVNMTAINMMIHGLWGEVIWGNSLLLEFKRGFLINGTLKKQGVPSILPLARHQSFMYSRPGATKHIVLQEANGAAQHLQRANLLKY